MAITGKFIADFSSFIDAINKAELKLVDFGKGASGVETKLNNMVDSFSGRKLIQEASLMTIAVEKSGGVAALTAKEFERVGATANEAADKLRRLGYEVPPGLQTLADATKDVGREANSTRALLSGLQQQLAGMFTIGAVIAFGREVLNAGDSIQKMSDQTHFSSAEVQKLQYIAGQSSSSIQSLIGASQELTLRLGDENSGAAGAVKKLVGNLDAFQKLGAYDQLVTLGDALGQIKNPTDQAASAAAIFGKNWKEILPAIRSGMRDVGNQAPLMADETVKSLDRIGDALTRAKAQAVSWGGTTVTWIEQAGFALGDYLSKFQPSNWGMMNSQLLAAEVALNDKTGLAGAMSKLVKPSVDVAKGITAIGMSSRQAADLTEYLNETAKDSIALHEKQAAAAKKAADELAKLLAHIQDIERGSPAATFKIVDLKDAIHSVGLTADANADVLTTFANTTVRSASDVDALRGSVEDLERKGRFLEAAMVGVNKQIGMLPNVVPKATKAIDDAREAAAKSTGIFATLKDSLENLWKGFSGGDGLSGVFANIGKGAVDQLGRALTGGIQGLIGLGVKGIGSLFGKLFSNPEKEINPIRQAFVDAAGGLSLLNERAHDAGVTLNALLNAKNPEAYKKAIDDLNAAFQFQDSAMQTLDDTAKKYGFTLAEMPDKFRQGKLDEQFLQLFQDQKVLTAGGFDFDAVLQKQVASFQDLITTALETGATIPAQMKPAIERLIDLGLVTDASGEKLEDIGKLTFAETLDAEFTTLIDTINKLSDAISRGLGLAIASIPDRTVHIGFQVDDFPKELSGDSFAAGGGIVAGMGIQHFAGGGNVLPFMPRGTDTVPAMLTPGEMVLNRSQQSRLLGLADGRTSTEALSNADVVNELQGLRVELASDRRLLPKMIRDAILLAS
jgi:hypothetical protein